MNDTAAVHDVFVKARNLLDRDGWIQHDLVSANGRCALGALIGHERLDSTPYIAAYTRLGARVGDIPTWNNAPERTKEEVLAVFDELANATAPPPPDFPTPTPDDVRELSRV